MPEKNLLADLQTLWDELNQPEDARKRRLRQQRFAERAAQFAQAPYQETTYADDEIYKALVFRVGEERYAVTVDVVSAVTPAEKITRVPGVPPYYRGVINLRGQMVSVLDLQRFLNLPHETSNSADELIFVKGDTLTLALVSKRVEGVQIIPKTHVEAVDIKYAHGVTADHIILLDIDYLLSDDRLIIRGK